MQDLERRSIATVDNTIIACYDIEYTTTLATTKNRLSECQALV